MDESGRDYHGAPHGTPSFRATPERPTLLSAYLVRCARATADPPWTALHLIQVGNVDENEIRFWLNYDVIYLSTSHLWGNLLDRHLLRRRWEERKKKNVHLSKTVLPQRLSWLESEHFWRTRETSRRPNRPNLWTHRRVLMGFGQTGADYIYRHLTQMPSGDNN